MTSSPSLSGKIYGTEDFHTDFLTKYALRVQRTKPRSLDYKFNILRINIVSARAVTFFIFCLYCLRFFLTFHEKIFSDCLVAFKSKLSYHESHYNNMKTPNLYWGAWSDNIKFQIIYGISIWVTENMRLISFSCCQLPHYLPAPLTN